jgi:hypothetical protein
MALPRIFGFSELAFLFLTLLVEDWIITILLLQWVRENYRFRKEIAISYPNLPEFSFQLFDLSWNLPIISSYQNSIIWFTDEPTTNEYTDNRQNVWLGSTISPTKRTSKMQSRNNSLWLRLIYVLNNSFGSNPDSNYLRLFPTDVNDQLLPSNFRSLFEPTLLFGLCGSPSCCGSTPLNIACVDRLQMWIYLSERWLCGSTRRQPLVSTPLNSSMKDQHQAGSTPLNSSLCGSPPCLDQPLSM